MLPCFKVFLLIYLVRPPYDTRTRRLHNWYCNSTNNIILLLQSTPPHPSPPSSYLTHPSIITYNADIGSSVHTLPLLHHHHRTGACWRRIQGSGALLPLATHILRTAPTTTLKQPLLFVYRQPPLLLVPPIPIHPHDRHPHYYIPLLSFGYRPRSQE